MSFGYFFFQKRNAVSINSTCDIVCSKWKSIVQHAVMHKTRLVQWTWNVLLIQDYPGVSDECNPCSSHPSYENPLRQSRIPEEMTILGKVTTTWCLVDITPLRTSQEAEETKEKWKRKAQITFLVPSVKFRHPMPAFRPFEYLIRFWSY